MATLNFVRYEHPGGWRSALNFVRQGRDPLVFGGRPQAPARSRRLRHREQHVAGLQWQRHDGDVVGVWAGRVAQRGARRHERGAGTVGHHIVCDRLRGRHPERVHRVLGHAVHRGRQEADPAGKHELAARPLEWQCAGVAYYGGWKTPNRNNVSPDTDWVVMCGTNAGSQLKLLNGVDVGTETGGTGDQSLFVNGGNYASWESSDFAIAEVVVWPRGLTSAEMHRASEHLMSRLG
eukprot:scaffold20089_cov59-Phaeocystis_antarctica.AAC.1